MGHCVHAIVRQLKWRTRSVAAFAKLSRVKSATDFSNIPNSC